MSTSSFHAPLCDYLPFSPRSDPCCVLVNDTLESDGRFVLYQLAALVFLGNQTSKSSSSSSPQSTAWQPPPSSSKSTTAMQSSSVTKGGDNSSSSLVYWLSAAPYSTSQIQVAMQKLLAGSSSSSVVGSSNSRTGGGGSMPHYHSSKFSLAGTAPLDECFHVRSLPMELAAAEAMATSEEEKETTDNDDDNVDTFDWRWKFLNSIYSDVEKWITSKKTANGGGGGSCCSWIILDDVSTLSQLLLQIDTGDDTTTTMLYCWIRAIHSLAIQHSVGVAIRSSIDFDLELWNDQLQQQPILFPAATGAGAGQQPQQRSTHRMAPSGPTAAATTSVSDWIGAGGHRPSLAETLDNVPWERSLLELANVVVDVTPLASGASRDAHGRLTITKLNNYMDVNTLHKTTICNYCLTDTSVQAIRLS